MDDFELFRARSLRGGILGSEQTSVEQFNHDNCLDRRRGSKLKSESKSEASETPPENCPNFTQENLTSECRCRRSKFWARCDDVIAMPEVVRCSNAWVDFSTTKPTLPARKTDRGPKAEVCKYKVQNARICRRSKPFLVGLNQRDTQTQEFDVYRLRSFATDFSR